jgi:hypothetical protein
VGGFVGLGCGLGFWVVGRWFGLPSPLFLFLVFTSRCLVLVLPLPPLRLLSMLLVLHRRRVGLRCGGLLPFPLVRRFWRSVQRWRLLFVRPRFGGGCWLFFLPLWLRLRPFVCCFPSSLFFALFLHSPLDFVPFSSSR